MRTEQGRNFFLNNLHLITSPLVAVLPLDLFARVEGSKQCQYRQDKGQEKGVVK